MRIRHLTLFPRAKRVHLYAPSCSGQIRLLSTLYTPPYTTHNLNTYLYIYIYLYILDLA